MATLYDIGRWYEHHGLVGEKSLALVQTIVAISGKSMGFGLEAPAGSGKTVTMDLLVGDEGDDKGLINNKYVYFKDAGSATSFFYDADNINKAKIVVFKELQKDKSDMTVEAIKSLTEGKSAGRKVTDIVTDGIKKQEIKAKTVLYTLAIENDTKPDAELRRRCITMATDVSKEQTSDVLDLKAKLRWDKDSIKILTDDEEATIKQYVNDLMTMDFNVVNPFAPEFAKIIATIAPDQKVRSMAEHFWNVMEGITKLNCDRGARVLVNGDTLICNIHDLYQTLDVYKQSFLRDVYSIPPLGDIILKGFADSEYVSATDKGPSSGNLAQFVPQTTSNWVDVNHLRKAIKEVQKVVLAKNVVIQICRQLVDAGYLEDFKDGTTIKYQVQEKYKEFDRPDYDRMVQAASKLVKDKYGAAIHAKWLVMQSKDYQNPLTGKVTPIAKSAIDIVAEDDIM